MTEDDRVQSRADELLPEETTAGSADPAAQAEAILEESDERQNDRNAAPSTVLEHRTSEETTEPAGCPPRAAGARASTVARSSGVTATAPATREREASDGSG